MSTTVTTKRPRIVYEEDDDTEKEVEFVVSNKRSSSQVSNDDDLLLQPSSMHLAASSDKKVSTRNRRTVDEEEGEDIDGDNARPKETNPKKRKIDATTAKTQSSVSKFFPKKPQHDEDDDDEEARMVDVYNEEEKIAGKNKKVTPAPAPPQKKKPKAPVSNDEEGDDIFEVKGAPVKKVVAPTPPPKKKPAPRDEPGSGDDEEDDPVVVSKKPSPKSSNGVSSAVVVKEKEAPGPGHLPYVLELDSKRYIPTYTRLKHTDAQLHLEGVMAAIQAPARELIDTVMADAANESGDTEVYMEDLSLAAIAKEIARVPAAAKKTASRRGKNKSTEAPAYPTLVTLKKLLVELIAKTGAIDTDAEASAFALAEEKFIRDATDHFRSHEGFAGVTSPDGSRMVMSNGFKELAASYTMGDIVKLFDRNPSVLSARLRGDFTTWNFGEFMLASLGILLEKQVDQQRKGLDVANGHEELAALTVENIIYMSTINVNLFEQPIGILFLKQILYTLIEFTKKRASANKGGDGGKSTATTTSPKESNDDVGDDGTDGTAEMPSAKRRKMNESTGSNKEDDDDE